jgi:hypothetical protein
MIALFSISSDHVNCNVIEVDGAFECTVCKFRHSSPFYRECTLAEELVSLPNLASEQVEPYRCIHTGEVLEVLDMTKCNCSNRGKMVAINKCNLYNKECGLLKLLKYPKRKELLDKGVLDCMECPNRFDHEENTENEQKGV